MRSVAILGASRNRSKFGNKSVRAHLRAGYRVIPVNPNESEIEGLPTCARLADVSGKLDRVSVYLPPTVSLEQLPEIAAADATEVWFNPGAANAEVLAEARRLGIRAIDGCSIVDLGLSPADFP